jgi:hypothetical protein
MRFTLTIPPALTQAWRAVSATRVEAPGFAIELLGMQPLPDDLDAWITAVLDRDLPISATIARGPAADRATELGWPMRLVDARVARGADALEIRVAAFYRFFEYGAVALGRAAAPVARAQAEAALAILATAEPDWSDEIVAVHQLWAD